VKSLTARQQEVLNIIKAAIEHTGRPPTRAEIAQQLGFRSANAAEDHLQALAKKGALILDASTSRGIRLAAEHLEAAGTLSERFLDTVKKTENAWHGQIVVARLNDEVTVKRYFSQGGRIQLLPENPAFKPIPIEDEDHFSIEGLAVGLLRVGQLG